MKIMYKALVSEMSEPAYPDRVKLLLHFLVSCMTSVIMIKW